LLTQLAPSVSQAGPKKDDKFTMNLDLDQFHTLPRVGHPAIHPGGTSAVLALARLSDDKSKRVSELWQVKLSGEEPASLLLRAEQSCSAPQFGDDGYLYFLSKQDTSSDQENDIGQVWRMREGEDPEAITNEPLGVLEYRVAGSTLVVLAEASSSSGPVANTREKWRDEKKNGPSGLVYTEMNVRSWDHWTGGPAPHFVCSDLKGQGRRDLTPTFDKELRADHGLDWDLSADGKTLVSVCLRQGPDRLDDSSLLLVDTASGGHRHLGQSERMTHLSVKFSSDGKRIAAARHVRERGKHGDIRLVWYASDGGDAHQIAEDWDAQPSIADWHGDDALLVTAPNSGHVPLYRVSIQTNEVVRLTSEAAGGTHSDISCVGDKAMGMRHSFTHPPELFEVALEVQSTPRVISALSGLETSADLAFENLTCIGADNTPVQYFFLPSTKVGPARGTILSIHGGPVSAWGEGWHWRWNPLPLLAAGYNVALPNPRGSSGFGQEFIDGVTGNQWGGPAFQDLMAVTDALCERSDVDADKLVAMGGSFGGYMSNWIGTQTDRFAAIITHASLYRLSAFHGTTDYPAYWAHDMGLNPSEDEEKFDKYSPHKFIDNWKTPVLIIHGEKDYRVPISEALMLFEDLRHREIDAKLLVFPDENHWILAPRNSEQWYRECLLFLDARL
jgi:dipeptidyl aminopeptidase/acylaminoacyl peptidase